MRSLTNLLICVIKYKAPTGTRIKKLVEVLEDFENIRVSSAGQGIQVDINVVKVRFVVRAAISRDVRREIEDEIVVGEGGRELPQGECHGTVGVLYVESYGIEWRSTQVVIVIQLHGQCALDVLRYLFSGRHAIVKNIGVGTNVKVRACCKRRPAEVKQRRFQGDRIVS